MQFLHVMFIRRQQRKALLVIHGVAHRARQHGREAGTRLIADLPLRHGFRLRRGFGGHVDGQGVRGERE
jgi:hypothetical protein